MSTTHRRAREDSRRCWWRTLGALLVAVAAATDELFTALLGIAPLTPRLTALRRWVADQWKSARGDFIDVPSFEPGERPVWR